MIKPVVWVADVGSIQNNRFGWCRSANQQDFHSGLRIDELAARVARDLDEGMRVALGPVRRQDEALSCVPAFCPARNRCV